MKRRRIFFDLETSPLQVLVWSINDNNNAHISHENIVKDRAVIIVGWKWQGSSKTEALTWDSNQNDAAMLKKFVPILCQATEIVAHNGDAFDVTWLRGRCLVHGIPFPPNLPTFDTLKAARSKFRLPSNRLDYLSKTLVGDGKLKTGSGLWRAVCIDKDPKALEQMKKYCMQDVRLLEKVFERMRPWLDAKTTVAANSRDCPECGSSHTRHHDRRISAAGTVKVQFRCMDCGSFHSVSGAKYDTNKALSVG